MNKKPGMSYLFRLCKKCLGPRPTYLTFHLIFIHIEYSLAPSLQLDYLKWYYESGKGSGYVYTVFISKPST